MDDDFVCNGQMCQFCEYCGLCLTSSQNCSGFQLGNAPIECVVFTPGLKQRFPRVFTYFSFLWYFCSWRRVGRTKGATFPLLLQLQRNPTVVAQAPGVPGKLIGELMVTAELHQTLSGETWLQSPEELPEPSMPFRSGSELPIPVLRGGKRPFNVYQDKVALAAY